MNTEGEVSSLIGQLYGAAGNQPLWPDFLENLAAALHGYGTQIISFNTRSRVGSMTATARIHPDHVKSYNEYYIQKDYWSLRGPQFFLKPNVLTGQMICSDAELERSEFYDGLLRPVDALHIIGAVAARDGDELAVVTSLRPKRAEPFGEDEIALMEALLPHFERAVQFQRRIAILEAQSETAANALDRLPIGLILVDSSGKILLTNAAAGAILAQGDGLKAARGGLETARSDETTALRGLIYGACATASGRGFASGGAIRVSRPSLKRPFSVLVVPLCADLIEMPGPRPTAAVFVSDPEAETEPNEAVISRLFGLTGAESRVAALLMQGKSIEESANELGVSLNTARTHVKQIFSKTGTTRQGELIRLLFTSPALLRAGS